MNYTTTTTTNNNDDDDKTKPFTTTDSNATERLASNAPNPNESTTIMSIIIFDFVVIVTKYCEEKKVSLHLHCAVIIIVIVIVIDTPLTPGGIVLWTIITKISYE